MSQDRPNPLIRFLPSLTDLAFVMPLVLLFGRMEGARTLLADGDTGWHLRTGEWILANGRVPDRDLFSFTMPDRPWFAWEWGWDVAFAWLHAHGGLAAVVLASLLLICSTFVLLFRLARRASGSALVAIALTMLAMASSSIHWLARPHLVTLVMVLVFYGILDRVHATRGEGSRRNLLRLALLPAMTVVWTNLHGGFVAGIALIVCYAAGELAGALFDPACDRARALAAARRYALAAAGCFAASFVNPYFYRLHVHIAHYLADPLLFRLNIEFQPLGFQHPAAPYFECGLLLAAGAAFWNLYHKRFAEVFLLAAWGHLALHAIRNYPIFALVAAPIVARAVCEWARALRLARVAGWVRPLIRRFARMDAGMGKTDALPRAHLVSACAAIAAGFLLFAPAAPAGFDASFDPAKFPVRAAGRLAGDAGSRVFTDDEWGDYLIYALYPRLRVFVDGRSDFYGCDFIERNMLKPLRVKYDWERTLESFGIDTILLPVGAPLAGALKLHPRWRLVYDDGVAILFRASGGAQVSAVADSGTARDRAVTKHQPMQPGDRSITPSQLETQTGAIHYDDFSAQFLERRAGAGPHRVHAAHGVCRAGLRRAVHQCGRQHQQDLGREQRTPGERRDRSIEVNAGRWRGMPAGMPLAVAGPPRPAAVNPPATSRGWS